MPVTRFDAPAVAAVRVLINFKAKLKAAAPLLGHVFAVEKTKYVSLVRRN
jgi:hypothetical protein